MSVANVDRGVNIRPGVSVLSVLRHLNYKPWLRWSLWSTLCKFSPQINNSWQRGNIRNLNSGSSMSSRGLTSAGSSWRQRNRDRVTGFPPSISSSRSATRLNRLHCPDSISYCAARWRRSKYYGSCRQAERRDTSHGELLRMARIMG
jgi:hypothetical protein